MIPEIPDETVTSEKGYYHDVHVLLKFKKQDGVGRKQEQAYMDPYPDEEDRQFSCYSNIQTD